MLLSFPSYRLLMLLCVYYLEANLYTQGLLRLIDKGVTATEVVTDAHIQIAALMSMFDGNV